MRPLKFIPFILGACLWLAACSIRPAPTEVVSPTETSPIIATATPTVNSTNTPVANVTNTPVATPTPAATLNPSPTPTQQIHIELTSTPTSIPTPPAIVVVPTNVQYVLALVDLNIRSGPGTTYPVIGSLFGGQIAPVIGITADGGWWRVICPNGAASNCFAIADPALTQPTTAPGGPPTPTPVNNVPERIEFQPGRTSETIASRVLADTQPKLYVLWAQAGQTMLVRLTSTEGRANFSLVGLSDGQPLKRMAVGGPVWQGALSLTQDYLITVAPTAGVPANYQLYIEISPLPDAGGLERIQFEPGATAATVYGHTSAIEPKRYTLWARGGQAMQVDLNVDNINAYFIIRTPTGEIMAGAGGPIHAWSGTLPVSGDYIIEVLNPGTGLANFDLTVTVE